MKHFPRATNTRPVYPCIAALVILTSFHNRFTWGAQPASQEITVMMVDGGLAMIEPEFHGLADRHLTTDERDQVVKFQDAIEKLRDRSEALYKSGADAAGATQLAKDFQSQVDVTSKYFQKHPNLAGKAGTCLALSQCRPQFLIDDAAVKAALAEARLAPDRLLKVTSKVDAFKKLVADLQAHPPKPAGRANRMNANGETIFELMKAGNDTYDDIRAQMSVEEAQAWDDAVFNHAIDTDYPLRDSLTELAWSADVDEVKAPRDGKYRLAALDESYLPGAPIFTVPLKKGQSIGFRVDKGSTTAFAEGQTVSLPKPDSVYVWSFELPEPKPPVDKH